MEEIITTIACLIGAILYLTLFFKVWGMTNNIKSLKKQLQSRNGRYRVRFALASKLSQLKEILFEELFAALYESYFNDKKLYEIEAEYKAYYTTAGLEYPKEFSNISEEKFSKFL